MSEKDFVDLIADHAALNELDSTNHRECIVFYYQIIKKANEYFISKNHVFAAEYYNIAVTVLYHLKKMEKNKENIELGLKLCGRQQQKLKTLITVKAAFEFRVGYVKALNYDVEQLRILAHFHYKEALKYYLQKENEQEMRLSCDYAITYIHAILKRDSEDIILLVRCCNLIIEKSEECFSNKLKAIIDKKIYFEPSIVIRLRLEIENTARTALSEAEKKNYSVAAHEYRTAAGLLRIAGNLSKYDRRMIEQYDNSATTMTMKAKEEEKKAEAEAKTAAASAVTKINQLKVFTFQVPGSLVGVAMPANGIAATAATSATAAAPAASAHHKI